MLDLTIAIPVKNEEKNLAGCIESIGKGFCSKVVLIDSGSTDHTRSIAASYDIPVINFEWDGKFPKKRNWYLRNHKPDTRWILFLDADEYLTPSFKNELTAVLRRDEKFDGYWLNYTIYFMGRQMKGGYPLQKLALIRTGAGEYEKIDENLWSNLDMEIHEHPVLTGAAGVIKSRIDHRDFRGVSHYITKHNEYSGWEAARYLQAVEDTENMKLWTWKQRIKYRLMRSVFIGPLYFLGSFIVMAGFRDGSRGFAFAILKMAYFTQVYCKIRELRQAK